MLEAIYFFFSGVSQALGIILNIDVPLSEEASIKFYWILFLLFVLYIFIRVSTYYLKGSSDGKR